jgi:hypothetical protein
MEKIVEVIFLLLGEFAKIIDKLKSGEIDPAKVNIDEWARKLEELQDLPE